MDGRVPRGVVCPGLRSSSCWRCSRRSLPAQGARAATTLAVDFTTGTDNATCGVSPNLACQTIAYTIANRTANGNTLTLAGVQFNEHDIIIHDVSPTLLRTNASAQ